MELEVLQGNIRGWEGEVSILLVFFFSFFDFWLFFFLWFIKKHVCVFKNVNVGELFHHIGGGPIF